MLRFALDSNQAILIESINGSKKIASFFDQEFNKKFNANTISIDTPIFLRKLERINRFLHDENIQPDLSDEFINLINSFPKYSDSLNANEIEPKEILERLKKQGFIRTPTKDQLKNLQKLCSIKAAASFSVPGAGKTTEALAFYAFHKQSRKSKLLVISPINAFISWSDEIHNCFNYDSEITRLRGTLEDIESKINSNPQHMIINYDSLRSVEKFDLIKNLITSNSDIIVVLDESHKSKGDSISRILSELAPFINYKLILTGTPMPQAPSDLRSQFNFLYPQKHVPFDEELVNLFDPIYVRTTKKDLGLMDVIYTNVMVTPNPGFKLLYDEYFFNKLTDGISLQEILSINSFKKAVLKLIKLFSNPASCTEEIFDLDPALANRIIDEGDGAKIDAVVKRAKDLIDAGEKVLIWSSFVFNVELIAKKFGSKAVFIHGGVKTSDDKLDEDADLDSREAKIRRFKEDPSCMVLVANPAAAAESISLHEQCNYALYLDRTYNAGQFLQSQDRIHRLISKEKEKQKYIEVFMLDIPSCVDWKVHSALNRKIETMAEFLNDTSLRSLEGFDIDSDYLGHENPMDFIDEEEFLLNN
jgi:SNF2 family DNA or RNA helicase